MNTSCVHLRSLHAACTSKNDWRRARRNAMNRIQTHREGGIASVYDRHHYAEENRRTMETVASKFIGLIEGGPANVLAFAR